MKTLFKFLMLFLLLASVACGSSKKKSGKNRKYPNREIPATVDRNTPGHGRTQVPSTPRSYSEKIEDYIALYAPIAQEEMRLYKIPASITLAQGILESGAGEGELTRRAHNHFGIKCHGWTGEGVYHDDDRSQECFRKYKHPKYSYRDHSLFLAERKRYAGLFDLHIKDYEGWAKGLRAAGYATDRKYPDKLISLIERYQLYLYDGDAPVRDAVTYNPPSGRRAHVVQKGDTLYSIARRYNMTVEELKKHNNLRDSNIGIGQKLLVTP